MRLNKELKELAQRKQLQRAMTLFRQGEKDGLADVHSYTNMVNAFVRCGKYDLAQHLFSTMKSLKISPNVVTYTILLKGFCAAGQMCVASDIVSGMAEEGIAPNLRTCNTFLRGCVRAGEVRRGIEFFHQMDALPDLSTYEYIISLLTRVRKVKEAEDVLSTLDESTGKDNVAVYLQIARAHALLGNWTEFGEYLSQSRRIWNKIPYVDSLKNKRELTPEEEEHFLCRVRSLRQFAEHRQEEFGFQLQFLEAVFARLNKSRPAKCWAERYFANVLVLEQADAPRTKRERVMYAVTQLEETFGCEGARQNDRLSALVGLKFAEDGRLNLGNDSCVKLEICAGSGDWARAQAQQDPSSTWVTVEILSDRVYDTFSGFALENQDNVLALQGDANIVLDRCIPMAVCDWVFINHPEPPERNGGTDDSDGHHLLTKNFFAKLSKTLKPTGKVTIVTDNLKYGRSLRHIASSSGFQDAISLVNAAVVLEQRACRTGDNTSSMPVTLCEGTPGLSSGHIVDASSKFDRLWRKGDKKRRFYLTLQRKVQP